MDDCTSPAPRRRDPLGTQRLLVIFCGLSFALLFVLALAPAKDYFSEWRAQQEAYNQAAALRGMAPMEVKIQQTWIPSKDIVDRCTSCHVGMGPAEPIPGHPVFDEHPPIPHEPREFGCTSCHQGQGRATTKEQAHGRGPHVEWERPLIPQEHIEASCGTCHASVPVPPTEEVARGAYLFDLHGCRSCHKVDGDGGVVGPDLSTVGLKGFDRAWHLRHLTRPSDLVEGSQMMNFGHLPEEELEALITYMDTLVGAPELMRGKALANSQGCRGCHVIRGAGGDMGPVLDGVGSKSSHDLDFSGVEGPHTAAAWHAAHLRDPQGVVPGSRMPRPDLDDEQVDAVVTYLLSLRKEPRPLEQLPKAEAVARLEGRKDHARSGEALYRNYCAACHGAGGEGRELDELGARVPAITNPDFLAVASDAFLRTTIEHGRPGRDMPGWGGGGGGLDAEEVEAVLAYLRSHEATPPGFEEVMAEPPDPALGALLFEGQCARCHGAGGDGTVLAPSLVNDEFLTIASERFLYRTIVEGRPGTAMPSHRGLSARQVRALLAFLDGHRTRPREDVSGYRAAGSVTYGKTIYDAQCSSCHGRDGGGGVGPALANPAFLATASDGFLAATIREGRGNRAMRAFGRGRGGISELAEREIDDVVTYIRSWQTPEPRPPLLGHPQGDAAHGAEMFSAMCAGCHGAGGTGGFAPALANPGFLEAASTGYLQATILKGRAGTAMRAWGGHGFAELTPQEVADLTTFIRSLNGRDTP